MGDNDSEQRFSGISKMLMSRLIDTEQQSTEHTANLLSNAAKLPRDRWTMCGKQGIRRPVSRVLCRPRTGATIIPLDRPLLDGSRDQPGRLRPMTALPRGAASLFGLAPGGACHAVPVARPAVGSYPTLSPLPRPKPRRFAFCGAIPGVAPGGRYPPPCHSGARTFLVRPKAAATARPSDPRGK